MPVNLSEAQMSRLVPLLGSVARLLARDFVLEDGPLRTLLLGADVEADAAMLEELKLWTLLLETFRDQPTELQRMLTTEALMMRGLPEASVYLALSTVATLPDPSSSDPPLARSSNSRPGESTSSIFHELNTATDRVAPRPRRKVTLHPWRDQKAGANVEPAASSASSASSASATSPAPIYTDTLRLDFGELGAGEHASKEIEVRGGPGYVISGSDQLTASPDRFGSGPTKIHIALAPLNKGLLWTTVQLVGSTGSIEVEVVAQWMEGSAAQPVTSSTPTLDPQRSRPPDIAGYPTGDQVETPGTRSRPQASHTGTSSRNAHNVGANKSTQTFVVALDGRGTHRTLSEALAQASPGTTIYMEDGQFKVGHGINITVPVNIRGRGISTTELIGDGDEFVLQYKSNGDSGQLTLSDLTVRSVGSNEASCVSLLSGHFQAKRCRFIGNTGFTESAGAGVLVRGHSDAVVEDCVAENNGHGIKATDHSRINVAHNICRSNSDTGIAFVGGSEGVAEQNSCTGNANYGIYVDEQASVRLTANACLDNGNAGIAYFGNSGGTALQNNCLNNGTGIYIDDQAGPSLQANTCHRNKQDGISFRGSSRGIATGNKCIGNLEYGLFAESTAVPELRNNRCLLNKSADFRSNGTGNGNV